MTSRERVKKILNFEMPDRPAIDLGSTRMTGISAWIYRELKRRLGIKSDEVKVFDMSQMLAEVEMEVLEELGCDFVMLPMQILPLELSYGDWKDYKFWDGQTFKVPAEFNPKVLEDGTLIVGNGRNWEKETRRMPKGCRYLDRIEYPDIKTMDFDISHIDKKDWVFSKPLSDEFLKTEENNAKILKQSTDKAIVSSGGISGAWGMPAGYGGVIGWGIKMALDPNHAKEHMMAEAEALSKRIKLYLEAVGNYIDVIVVSGTDFGAQKKEQFNPDLFKEFFVPAWKMVTDTIHKFADIKIFIHSCGCVRDLIPYFIDAGVDIYNPVQWSADNMDREELKKEFGNKIVFWGGAVNTQKTFPFGTSDEVRKEVKETINILGKGGGYVVNPVHNIQPDVPVENIIALYETAKNYRYS
ncbi:methyltransferase [bacterium]|nr:methyltransferase [bacterium]